MLHIHITEQDFEPFSYLSQHQVKSPQIGAQGIFVGYMRDFREEKPVESMTITHYPPMTEQHLQQQAAQLIEEYQLLNLLIVHRVGCVTPMSPLVLIASSASHRTNAMAATQEMLEVLKFTAPFWKQEHYQGSSTWVEANTANTLSTKTAE